MLVPHVFVGELFVGWYHFCRRTFVDELDGDHAIARSSADAPGIDGVVRIDDGGDLSPGSFVTVDITASTEYDLVGRVSSAQLDDRA